MAIISIKTMKRLRNTDKVTKVSRKGIIKKGVLMLLKKENAFVDMDEIRCFFMDCDNNLLHTCVNYLVRKGIIVRLYVDRKAFYGLPEFLDE